MFNLELNWDRPAKISSETTTHLLRVRLTPESTTITPQSLPLLMGIALDTSSSMNGEKLEAAKLACQTVIALLRDSDRLSLAAFSSQINPLLRDLAGGANALTQAATAITKLQAHGVTRTDLALRWLAQSLPPEAGVSRVGILITDGQATNPGGAPLDNLQSLVTQGEQLSSSGIVLCTVGLGDAENFNTGFLTDLSDKGRGAFLYADNPSSLQMLLQERLSAYQAIATNEAKLIFKLKPGVKTKGFCCIRPDYIPLEESAINELTLTSLRTNTPTDILISLETPPGNFGEPQGVQEIIEIELMTPSLAEPVKAKACLNYTNSYSEAAKADIQIEKDRLIWEINIYSKEVIDLGDSNPKRTGVLLENIQVVACRAGKSDLAEQAAEQLDKLQKTGQLDAHKTTRMLTTTRNLNLDDE